METLNPKPTIMGFYSGYYRVFIGALRSDSEKHPGRV